MYFTLADILLVLGFGAVCLYFLSSIRVRELAVKAVTRAGEEDDYQLLDFLMCFAAYDLAGIPNT